MSKKNGLLWQIQAPDGGPVGYVFGTMHVRDARAFGFFDAAKKAISSCQTFATEFRLDEAEADPTAFDRVGRLAEGQSIRDFLTPSVIQKLEKRLQKLGLPPVEFWQNRHPMFLQTALTDAILGMEMPEPLDRSLFDFALGAGKKCIGIESLAEQIEIFERLPVAEQFDGLSTTVKNWGRFRRNLRRTADFYEKGDLASLYRSARRSAKGLRSALLFDRNEKMTARIAAFAAESSLFAAIGAGHLGGAKGVLRGLKKAGFRVRAVAFGA